MGFNLGFKGLTPPTEEQHLIYRTMIPVLWVDSAHSVTGIKAAFNSDNSLSATVSSTECYDILLRIYRMYYMTFLKVCPTWIKISNTLHVAWTGHCRTQCTLCKSLKTKLDSYSTTNKMHLLSQIIYSCKTLCMFWTGFPSIIRSSKLHIQQQYMSNSCCYLLLLGMRWNAVYAVLSSWWWT